MSKKTVRVALSAVVILGAFTLLMAQTVRESAQYYKHVDEVMNAPEQWYGKNMQLHGFVVNSSIEQRPNTLDYRFKIMTGDYNVLATYTGVVPDTFKDGAEVAAKAHRTRGNQPCDFRCKRDRDFLPLCGKPHL